MTTLQNFVLPTAQLHHALPCVAPKTQLSTHFCSAQNIATFTSTRHRRCSFAVRMGLKEVEAYDSFFELKPDCEETLHSLLNSDAFRSQVSEQLAEQLGSSSGSDYEFTGELFQPVPWSITTKHGMPQEFEKYFGNPDYAIINVPPNFMFKAKIFKPSRLCAIFKRIAGLPVDA